MYGFARLCEAMYRVLARVGVTAEFDLALTRAEVCKVAYTHFMSIAAAKRDLGERAARAVLLLRHDAAESRGCGCVYAWVRGCVGAWVRGCVGAWVRGCVGAWAYVCVVMLCVLSPLVCAGARVCARAGYAPLLSQSDGVARTAAVVSPLIASSWRRAAKAFRAVAVVCILLVLLYWLVSMILHCKKRN
jgi:hypothetical protein